MMLTILLLVNAMLHKHLSKSVKIVVRFLTSTSDGLVLKSCLYWTEIRRFTKLGKKSIGGRNLAILTKYNKYERHWLNISKYLCKIPYKLLVSWYDTRIMNILAIGAHPDDIELGCGGLLIKAARNGHSVFLYNITRGEKSGSSQDRVQELRRSAKYMGAKALYIDRFPDTELALTSDLINHIESCVNVCRPDLVITHPMTDTHHDHRIVAEASIEAARNVSTILSYEMPLTKNFDAHLYYDISDSMDAKLELLSVFESQSHKIFLESRAIRGLAQYRALQSRQGSDVSYSESFQIVKASLDTNFALFNAHSTKVHERLNEETLCECIYV